MSLSLPVSRAIDLEDNPKEKKWLIEGLWAQQAVGILGGEPKCCKSFLALDMAVSVAAGTPCLRSYEVQRSGPVLIFPAEDSLPVVRERLAGICKAANVQLADLPVYVITAPRVLLDRSSDQALLRATVEQLRPVLLILDPFIRLHTSDENASKDVAPILGYLRELQRAFSLAVLLVHHTRKGSNKGRPGQALRGSSDLHGWGDSNLYIHRSKEGLTLSVEHRAAPCVTGIGLKLDTHDQQGVALSIFDEQKAATPMPQPRLTPEQRVLNVIRNAHEPLSTQRLRDLCHMRTATLCKTIAKLSENGLISHQHNGYITADPAHITVSFPSNP